MASGHPLTVHTYTVVHHDFGDYLTNYVIAKNLTLTTTLCSVECLPEKPVRKRDYLEMLVVFGYDTLIPSHALETIWDKDIIHTESYRYEW